jgi:serine-type D-Ala-D-Ala carboxypeptidase
MSQVVAAVTLALLAITAHADDFADRCRAAFDTAIPAQLEAAGIPGAVIAIGVETPTGRQSWCGAYGRMSREPDAPPMRPDTLFDLASLTKPIATGTAVMLLVEQGKLALDEPVSKRLSEFYTPTKRGITLWQLMTHTSCLPASLDERQRDAIRAANPGDCTRAVRDAIRRIEPAHAVGGKTIYSCLNAIVCAELVEKVAGEPLDRFAQSRVFGPLRMSDAGFRPSESLRSRIAPTTRLSAAEGPFRRGVVHDPLAEMQGGVSGNAGLFATAADLERFARMLLGGGELDGVRVLSAASVAEMIRVQTRLPDKDGKPDDRGLLWDVFPEETVDGVTVPESFGHTGYTGVALRVFPSRRGYAIALTNRVHPDDKADVAALRQSVWSRAAALLSDSR